MISPFSSKPETAGRAALLVLSVALLVLCLPARADGGGDSLYTPSKQFSSDVTVTLKDGVARSGTLYMDNGKVRVELHADGLPLMAGIIREDAHKMYLLVGGDTKSAMAMPYNPDKLLLQLGLNGVTEDKLERVGSDLIAGLPCTKFKTISANGVTLFYWIDEATKTPIKIADSNNTFVALWSHFKNGPQDPSLFEIPADYQLIDAPNFLTPGLTPP